MDERELRRRFEALRDHDAQESPAFGSVLDRVPAALPAALPAAGRRWSYRLALPLAAAAALVLAAGVVRISRRREFVPQPLSRWTSPTASLLRTPGIELLNSPTLMPSILDRVAPTTVPRHGTHP